MSTSLSSVFILNNYDLVEARRRYVAGEYPGQHLWGADDLDARLPSWRLSAINWLRRGLRARVRNSIVRWTGDPLQQVWTLMRARSGDVVYCAEQTSGLALTLFRRLGLLRAAILIVAHHPPRSARERRALKSADAVWCLSPAVADSIRACGIDVEGVLPWGPDLASAVYSRAKISQDLDFAAAGKTNRDYRTLSEAATIHGLRGVIYDGEYLVEYPGELTTRVRLEYPDVLALVARAAVVVIPLRDPQVMAGLTEASDAIALRKTLVVTKSDAFPYPTADSRAGVEVPADASADSLADAIKMARALPREGIDALRRRYNMTSYVSVLREEIDRLSGRPGAA